ncbi:hypothetical protein [Flagellimonas sp.]|uniref:hypothetical protein n=1 Tax=Flagellimonas sp. TaxID=2058762 RepID=UPI003BB0CE0F
MNFFNRLKWDKKIEDAKQKRLTIEHKKKWIAIKALAIEYYYDLLLLQKERQILENELKDTSVFSLLEPNRFMDGFNSIITVFEKAYSDFEKQYGKIKMKPEIVFLPFQGNQAGKKTGNLLILNQRFLTDTSFNKKTIVHETLHFWLGESLVFENTFINEGITEYCTLQYLRKKREFKEVDILIVDYKSKASRNFKVNCIDLEHPQISNKEVLNFSYNYLPLLLSKMKAKGKNIDNQITDFYIFL